MIQQGIQQTGFKIGYTNGNSLSQRLFRIVDDGPVEEIKIGKQKIHGITFYTAEPIGGIWKEMTSWVSKMCGSSINRRPTAKHIAKYRWFTNDHKFYFRNEADRTMFVLKWR